MQSKRYVKQNATGGWDVLKEGHRRASVQTETRSQAVARAKDIVKREGGGEVQIVNRMGKIEDANKVARSTK
jgi:hypothetical protein